MKKTVNDFYAAICRRDRVETQSQHQAAMREALDCAHNAGLCGYDQLPNGSGVVHQYFFKLGEPKPTFSCVSDDVFNQIEIL